MALDITSFDAALKQHYTGDRVLNMVYQDNPYLAMVPKMEEFGGRNMPIPTIWGNPQGRSSSFAMAQQRGLVSTSKLSAFTLTRVKDYSIANIDNETLEASKGDANAFLEAATVEIDGAINSLTRSLAISLYRSGYGDIGRVQAINAATITLTSPDDVTNFEVGQALDLGGTQTGAVRAYGANGVPLIITGVDRTNGVLTFGSNVTDANAGVPTAAPNDWIFSAGDHIANTRTKIAGLEAWLPATAPDNTLFYGVDRSTDVNRLGGQRLNIQAMPIEEGLIMGANLCAREGGAISHVFMNYARYADLEKALGTKIQYIDLKSEAQISFRGIMLNGPKGPVRVIPDQNCPSNRIFGLTLSTWKLCSLGKAVRVIDTDGIQMLRQASADAVEVRYGYYANQACRGPGLSINMQV